MARKRDDQLTEQEKKIISERIKNAMVHQLINQKELGEMIGVSRSAMSRAVTGSVITLGYLMKISKALNVSMDYLCGFSSKEDYSDREVLMTNLKQDAESMIKEIAHKIEYLGMIANMDYISETIYLSLQKTLKEGKRE